LFKVVVGLHKKSSGKVHVFGSEPGGHICIGYVPQRTQVDWDFPVTVYDVVMMGRFGKLGLFKRPGKKDKKIVDQALELVEMQHLSSKRINQLSGGQQQRVFIARALAQETGLLLMDEPLTGLDSNAQKKIIEIIERLGKQGVTILVSLHDLSLVENHFDKVLLINKKLVAFGKPEEVLSQELLREAYGSHLHIIKTEKSIIALEDTCVDKGGEKE